MAILTGILSFVLILVSLALVLLVLMQKSKDGGMGAALGGGATESAFGHETGNVLTGATIKAAVAFFVLSFVLYLGRLHESRHPTTGSVGGLEKIAPAAVPTPAPAPVVPTTTTTSTAPSVTLPGTATTSAPASTAPAVVPAPAATETPKPAAAP